MSTSQRMIRINISFSNYHLHKFESLVNKLDQRTGHRDITANTHTRTQTEVIFKIHIKVEL